MFYFAQFALAQRHDEAQYDCRYACEASLHLGLGVTVLCDFAAGALHRATCKGHYVQALRLQIILTNLQAIGRQIFTSAHGCHAVGNLLVSLACR